MSAMVETVGEAVGFPRDAKSVAYKDDPIALFQTWFQEAIDSGIKEPSAMTVATIDPDGSPDARMLLLKGVDERGFVFYTNMGSEKAHALMHHPRVALCFIGPISASRCAFVAGQILSATKRPMLISPRDRG